MPAHQGNMTSWNGNIFLVTGPLCGEFTSHRTVTVTRRFDVFFDLRLNKWLSKQSWGWWFETLSCPLWCHCNALGLGILLMLLSSLLYWVVVMYVDIPSYFFHISHEEHCEYHHISEFVFWGQFIFCQHRCQLQTFVHMVTSEQLFISVLFLVGLMALTCKVFIYRDCINQHLS